MGTGPGNVAVPTPKTYVLTRQFVFAADPPTASGDRTLAHGLHEARKPVSLEREREVGEYMTLKDMRHSSRRRRTRAVENEGAASGEAQAENLAGRINRHVTINYCDQRLVRRRELARFA